MKEFIVRFVPRDDKYCVEKELFVNAKSMIDAINFVLETESVQKITFFRRLVDFSEEV